jgi:hypothetical protein
MGDGGHPPGLKFHTKCEAKTGLTVTLVSGEVSIDATFAKQEDADYFIVGGNYPTEFRNPGAGKPSGGN